MPKNPVVGVKVPLRSGFDKSHHNLLTTKVGTITPIMCDEVIPNSKVSLRLAIAASLPPLAVDTFMKVDVRVEAFFVPMRLLCGSFESWFADEQVQVVAGSNIANISAPGLPTLSIDASALSVLEPGTLADYLGFRNGKALSNSLHEVYLSAMPFLAYHKVYDDYYRAPLVQKSIFARLASGTPAKWIPAITPFVQSNSSNVNLIKVNSGTIASTPTDFAGLYADNVPITSLRQRNFGFDYFTNAQPDPAYRGDVDINVVSNQFSIAALRAGNSLQQFRERNALCGPRMTDVVRARYGADLSNGVAQRSVLLGSAIYPVYSRSISVQGDNTNANNPFAAAAGGQVAVGYAAGSDFIIDNFVAQEPGYILVNATLVPHVTYASGVRRMLTRYVTERGGTLAEMANPLLQNVGNQPIYDFELSTETIQNTAAATVPNPVVFGYTDRYADFMTCEDEVHGLITIGESLASFAAQRVITGASPVIGTAFLQIPTNYLDNVTVVTSTLSTYGAWFDCDFSYKVSMPLAEYSQPSLQDPGYEHGQTIHVHRGGFRF